MVTYLLKINHSQVKKAILELDSDAKCIFLKDKLLLVKTKVNINFKLIFGVNSYFLARVFDLDLDTVKNFLSNELNYVLENDYFRITTNRHNKNFKYDSSDLNKIFGECIFESTKATGKMVDFDKEICVDIFDKEIVVYWNEVICFGGLPVGIQGYIHLNVLENKDLLKGLLLMKRGLGLIITNEYNLDLSLLKTYHLGYKFIECEVSDSKYSEYFDKINILGLLSDLEINKNLDLFNKV